MSATTTLRPTTNASGFSQTAVNTGGAGSAHAAVSDNSDSTYLAEASGPAPGSFAFGFGASGLTADDQILNVVVRVRYEKTSGTPSTGAITLYDPVTGVHASFSKTITATSPNTYASTPFTAIGPAPLSQAIVDRLVVFGAVQPNLRLYEVYLDVTYNTAPTVSSLAPSSTTGLASPVFSWTYADSEGDAQERVDLLIYDAATVAAAGMTTTPTRTGLALYRYDSIYTPLPYFSDTAIALPPGSYRFYLRAADLGGHRGAWAHADFTVASGAPPPPRVTAGTYDATFGRVPITVETYDNLLTDNQAGAETSTADFAFAPATASLDTSPVWSPPDGPTISGKSLKLVTSGAGGVTALTPATEAAGVPVVAGQAYVAGAHVFSATARLATATIEWVDASNANIGTTVGQSIPTATGSAPATIFVVGTAPAGAVKALVLITVAGLGASESTWMDDFFISATDVVAEQACSTWNGNLVSNTSFETYAGSSGAADWNLHTSGGSQSVTVQTGSTPADGAGRCVIAKPETSLAPPYAEWPNLAGGTPALPVSAGQVLIVTGYQKAVSISPGVTVEVVYQDASHDEFTCTAATSTDWEPFVVAVEIPSGKTSASVRFLPVGVGASGSQGTVEIDAVNIYVATSATVTAFHGLGGASGTPKGAGLGTSLAAFALGSAYQPFFPWVRGGFVPNSSYQLSRSVDGGATWEAVRGLAAFGVTFYDYEATPNATALYAAVELTEDPVGGTAVASAAMMPLIDDPGFERQLPWDGIDLSDTFTNAFQPFFGSLVGGISGVSSGADGTFLRSTVARLPSWATSLRVRFLLRTINLQAPILQTHWLDATGAEGFKAADVTLFSGSSGDSGWAWQEVTLTVPPFATSAQFTVVGPSPVDSAKVHLAVVDAFTVVPIGANGRSPATDVPALACVSWLKDPLNPAANMQVNIEVGGIGGSGASASGTESSSTETQLVMQPAGRAAPVVLADTIVSDEEFGTLQFVLEGDQQWAAIETLRKAQRTLLVQFPYGDLLGVQFYVRLGSVRTAGIVQTQDQNRHQRRRVSIPARQVEAP